MAGPVPYSLQSQMVAQLHAAARSYPSELQQLAASRERLTVASLCAGLDVAQLAINALETATGLYWADICSHMFTS